MSQNEEERKWERFAGSQYGSARNFGRKREYRATSSKISMRALIRHEESAKLN